jgi:hypothetical protein
LECTIALDDFAAQGLNLFGGELTGWIVDRIGQYIEPRSHSGTAAIGVSGQEFCSLAGTLGDRLNPANILSDRKLWVW